MALIRLPTGRAVAQPIIAVERRAFGHNGDAATASREGTSCAPNLDDPAPFHNIPVSILECPLAARWTLRNGAFARLFRPERRRGAWRDQNAQCPSRKTTLSGGQRGFTRPQG